MFQEIKASLRQLYLEDERPWLAGFSGNVGPKSLRPGPNAVRPYKRRDPVAPAEQVRGPFYRLLCAVFAAPSTIYRLLSTLLTIPAIAEMIEGTLDRMRKFSEQNGLNIDANLLEERWQVTSDKWPAIQHRPRRVRRKQPGPLATCHWPLGTGCFGRGYPPPNRTFRWCTQRMKIDPVNALVKQRVGHWGEAILHLASFSLDEPTRSDSCSL